MGNEANRPNWDPPLRAYVEDIQRGKGESKVQYTSRYIGSMVGDVHRTLLYGGLFGYPAHHEKGGVHSRRGRVIGKGPLEVREVHRSAWGCGQEGRLNGFFFLFFQM